jgi:glycine/D-amino acid oxidase-like deaminating enzyme
METDVLIIGQGLAGTVLGETFVQRGKSVFFIDQGHEGASSMVAAGMMNPMVFKRINKSWKVDDLLPTAVSFYKTLEQKIGQNMFCEYNILKFFANEAYKNAWNSKVDDNKYINKAEEQYPNKLISNDYGFGRVTNCSRVVLSSMLTTYRDQLRSENALLEETFEPKHLNIEKGHYKDIKFSWVVLCLGHTGAVCELFGWLPLRKTKGELLKIKAVQMKSDDLLNKGFFVVPVGNDEYVVGSTYDWNDKTTNPTQQGKNQIEEKLSKLYAGSYEIIEHTAGLRPTVIDRRPLIGLHPRHKNLGIFNGLGTKGVLIAPYFASQFADQLLTGAKLNAEVDIKRFN